MIELKILEEVIDRFIQFKKGRIQGRRQVFKELLEPTYLDLLKIHSDYISVFTNIRQMIPSGKYNENESGLDAVKNLLDQKRIQFAPIRESLKTLSKDLASRKYPKEESAFINSVLVLCPISSCLEIGNLREL